MNSGSRGTIVSAHAADGLPRTTCSGELTVAHEHEETTPARSNPDENEAWNVHGHAPRAGGLLTVTDLLVGRPAP